MKAVQYTRVEIPAKGQGKAILVSPGGEQREIYSFEKQEVSFSYEGKGMETVEKDGEPYSVFRFYPEETGIWTLQLCQDGEARQSQVQQTDGVCKLRREICIEVQPAFEAHGFVEISEKDSRYFAYSDGSPFMPIGINMVYPTSIFVSDRTEFGLSTEMRYLGLRQFERWFKACKANGVNMVRIWLGGKYFSPDTENAGELDLMQLAKLDALIALAEKYEMKLKITVESFRFFDYEHAADTDSSSDGYYRTFGKRLYWNGQRCESMTEWLAEKKWQDLWLNKMQELAKRLAGNPTVMAVELWNEMNAVSADYDLMVDWNRRMLPEVKKLFPRQLVINSLGSFDCERALQDYTDFCWELSDVKQMHRYLDRGAAYEVCHDSPIAFIRDGMDILLDGKTPFFLAETGAVNDCHSGPFVLYSADHRGLLFCDMVYTPLFLGAAGCGQIWHWDRSYVEAKNLYGYFKPLAELCRDVAFDEEEFQSQVYEDGEVILLLLKGKTVSLGYLRNKADNWQRVIREMEEDCPIAEKEISLQSMGLADSTSGTLPGTDAQQESTQKQRLQCDTIQIWQEETGSVWVEGDRLHLSDVRYGMFLMFTSKM